LKRDILTASLVPAGIFVGWTRLIMIYFLYLWEYCSTETWPCRLYNPLR